MLSLLNIVINILATLLRLAELLLPKPLSGVFPRERLSMARRVNLVHWSLLLVQRFVKGVFNFLSPIQWHGMKSIFNLRETSKCHRDVLLSWSVDKVPK